MFIKLLKKALQLLQGFVILTVILTALSLCFPIYIYRWCVTTWAKWFYKGIIGNPVTACGNTFAAEFLPSCLKRSPRCGVVTTTVFDGKVSVEELQKLIHKNWLSPQVQVCQYPEFMQYVEPWIGFMFWKQDLDFNLNNHIQYHRLNGKTDEEVEENVCKFVEDLLNKSFQPKRSPWECYVINDYKNENLQNQCVNEMTLIVIRVHHCLADGYSMLYAIIEGLLGIPLTSISLPSPTGLRITSLRKKILSSITFPFRLLHDISEFSTLHYSPKTAFHVPDDKKCWNQYYVRSPLIPIKCIKNIKNRLGVSFTGVLLSALAGGIAKTGIENQGIKSKGKVNTIPFLTMVPLPGHPRKLRNHVTSTYLQLPIGTDMESYKRLKNVEAMFENARNTSFPIFSHLMLKACGSLMAIMTKYLTKNSCIPAGLTNFPGPGIDIYLNDKRLIGVDFAAGLLPGVFGAGFMLLSYGKHVRFAMCLEQAVMSRKEANKMMEAICDEIKILDELSKTHVSEKTELLSV